MLFDLLLEAIFGPLFEKWKIRIRERRDRKGEEGSAGSGAP